MRQQLTVLSNGFSRVDAFRLPETRMPKQQHNSDSSGGAVV